MAKVIVPDVALREPNLLVPGKKPVGSVRIDTSHPMAPTEYWLLSPAVGLNNLARPDNPFVSFGTYEWKGNNIFYNNKSQTTNYLKSAQYYNTTAWGVNNDPFLMIISFTHYTNSDEATYAAICSSPTDTTPWLAFIQDLPADNREWYFDNAYMDGADAGPRVGTKTVMALQGHADGYASTYMDGVFRSTFNRGTWVSGSTSDDIYLNTGYWRDAACTCEYDYLYLLMGEPSQQQVLNLLADPYQFLIPA